MSCASYRALKMLQHVDKEASYEILPGVALVREAAAVERSAKEINLQELPSDSKLKAVKLVDMLIDGASKFISSRSLKIKITPDTTNEVGRAFEEQGNAMLSITNSLKYCRCKLKSCKLVVLSACHALSLLLQFYVPNYSFDTENVYICNKFTYLMCQNI